MSAVLAFTRNRRIPLNLRRLVGECFVRKSDREFEMDVGSTYRGRLDNYIKWMVFVTGKYFEFPYINLLRRLHKGGIALDVGANLGNHSLAFTEFFDRVYAIEPCLPVYKRLVARREVSDRIHPYLLALSDRSGSMPYRLADSDYPVTAGEISEDGDLSIDTVPGDEFVANTIEGQISFVKIDVDGHESSVIRGLADTIRSARPTIMVELSKEVLGTSGSFRSFLDLFPDDYVFHGLSGQLTWPVQREVARTTPIDREHPRPSRRSCDILCFGRERNFRLS
jgi:FkbM family methyltransferase